MALIDEEDSYSPNDGVKFASQDSFEGNSPKFVFRYSREIDKHDLKFLKEFSPSIMKVNNQNADSPIKF